MDSKPAGSPRPAQRLNVEGLRRMLANEADMSFRRRAEAVFRFIDLQPGDRVLDAGCGRGFYLNFLRALYPQADVLGIELDIPLLPVARRVVPGAAVSCVNLYQVPFADASFDKIIFSEVIEHIPDDRQALAELYRVLAPGGVLALTTPNANYPFWWDPINKTLEWTLGTHIQTGPLAGIWANHVRLYPLDQLLALVTDAGFKVEAVECHTHHCFPFIHNLVYGLGKELMVRGLLPDAMMQAADRFNLDADPRRGSPLNPVNLGLRLLEAFDRRNDSDPPGPEDSFLIIALKLRKPEVTP